MEHVNNDMDDLFRKAGELYPLKTSESDWGGVLGKLRDEISGETGIPYALSARGNSNRRRWFLLLLVPAFIFSLVYLTGSRVKEKNPQLPGKANNLPVNKNSPVASKNSSSPNQADNKITAGSKSQLNIVKDVTATAAVSATEVSSDEQAGRKSTLSLSSQTEVSKNAVVSGKITQDAALYQSASIQTKNLSDPESFHERVEKGVPLSVYGSIENPSVYGMPFPPLVLKDVTLNPETAKTSATAKINKPGSSKGIYAVLLGGPDLSTVAFQSTEQAGYSLGLLVGYRFNKRLAVETGLLWDKKNYNSSGEYFDKSKLNNFPAGVKILNVDGYCNMFEIPLNLRYDFANRNNHGFFVATGLSSYLMKKEYYNYELSANNGNPWPKDSTYFNSSKNLFSILQISGGYEYSIGKNTKIRIEPYVKIPLSGIGFGNMPISSAGLYFGISHSFH
jgi:Outer membrane protein beta-barrel domain